MKMVYYIIMIYCIQAKSKGCTMILLGIIPRAPLGTLGCDRGLEETQSYVTFRDIESNSEAESSIHQQFSEAGFMHES